MFKKLTIQPYLNNKFKLYIIYNLYVFYLVLIDFWIFWKKLFENFHLNLKFSTTLNLYFDENIMFKFGTHFIFQSFRFLLSTEHPLC